jgi:hypothetical protein
MTPFFASVPVAVALFVGAAFLLRRRSNPYALAALGATIAPVPALFSWFRATRALVERFHAVSVAAPDEMAATMTRALTAANDGVFRGQLGTAGVALLLFFLAIFSLSRSPERPAEASSSRSRLVGTTAFVALVSSLALYEIATDAVLFPLAVVASQQGRADARLPLTTEAAKALFMDSTSQDAVSSKVGEYMGAATIGSFLVMAVSVVGFVVSLVTSAGESFPRSSAVVGLVLVVALGAMTARELGRLRAIDGELRIIEARTAAPEGAGAPK